MVELPFLDTVTQLLAQYFAKTGQTVGIALPAAAVGVGVLFWLAIREKKTVKVPDPTKASPVKTAEGFLQSQEGPPPSGKQTDSELEEENESQRRVFSTSSYIKPPIIPQPQLKFNGGDEENQKMIDSSFAYYVSMALINSAPAARISAKVSSKYGEIKTIEAERAEPNLKVQIKEALKEVVEELQGDGDGERRPQSSTQVLPREPTSEEKEELGINVAEAET